MLKTAAASRAVADKGRSLEFFNESLSGGITARHRERSLRARFVGGVEGWADEARFGGVVIQAKED
jgi:hypothetical protein